jgi:CrcB protein
MLQSLIAISIGASVGAISRWLIGLWLNTFLSHVPLGTLVVNLVGGYLVGVAFAIFASHPNWSPEWRLLVVTGFLGGLTTFSAFSLEMTQLLQQEKWLLLFVGISSHVLGSIIMTLLGLWTVATIKA